MQYDLKQNNNNSLNSLKDFTLDFGLVKKVITSDGGVITISIMHNQIGNSGKIKKNKKVPDRITMNSENKQKEIIERRYKEINLIFLFFIFI